MRLARDLLGQVSGVWCQDYEPDGVENYKIPQSVSCMRTPDTLTPAPSLILFLKLAEAIVESLLVHQFGMAAGFDDAAPVEDDNAIDVANRR